MKSFFVDFILIVLIIFSVLDVIKLLLFYQFFPNAYKACLVSFVF